MQPDTIPGPHPKPPATTLARLGAAAIASAVIPALAGLAFLISLAIRRPLIGAAVRRWPWLTSYPPGEFPRRTQMGLTAFWGIGLLAAGAVQLAGAINGGLTITNPASFTVRALIALTVEAILAAITIIWLHRKPASARPSRTGLTGGGSRALNRAAHAIAVIRMHGSRSPGDDFALSPAGARLTVWRPALPGPAQLRDRDHPPSSGQGAGQPEMGGHGYRSRS
jgi:hypothetical protein